MVHEVHFPNLSTIIFALSSQLFNALCLHTGPLSHFLDGYPRGDARMMTSIPPALSPSYLRISVLMDAFLFLLSLSYLGLNAEDSCQHLHCHAYGLWQPVAGTHLLCCWPLNTEPWPGSVLHCRSGQILPACHHLGLFFFKYDLCIATVYTCLSPTCCCFPHLCPMLISDLQSTADPGVKLVTCTSSVIQAPRGC